MDKAREILEKIKDEKIEPKSRWRFLLKDYMIWVAFASSILVGSVAFSVIIFLLSNNDWDIYRYLDKNFISYLFLSLPYVWIIILALFAFIACFNYKHTKNGYRVNPIAIVLISILISIFLGGIMFKNGLGQTIDYTLSKNIPYYEKVLIHRHAVWNNPERGLLSGEIIKIEDKNNFSIISFNKENWEITGDDIYWRGPVIQAPGERIKIIGRIERDNIFKAQEVRPWMGSGRGMHQRMLKH